MFSVLRFFCAFLTRGRVPQDVFKDLIETLSEKRMDRSCGPLQVKLCIKCPFPNAARYLSFSWIGLKITPFFLLAIILFFFLWMNKQIFKKKKVGRRVAKFDNFTEKFKMSNHELRSRFLRQIENIEIFCIISSN